MARWCTRRDAKTVTLAPDGPGNVSPYAVVVVNTGLRQKVASATADETDDEQGHLTRAFHYEVPARLTSAIRIGQLVWVPFGSRHLQGIIARFDDSSPVEELREIDQIVDLEPVLSPRQIALAHWISEYYLAPIHRSLLGMLPPGVVQSTETRYRALSGAQPDDLSASLTEMLALLQSEGPLNQRQLAQRAGLENWRHLAEQLVKKGHADKVVRRRAPRVSPKREPVVRLSPGTAVDDLAKGANRQRQVVEYLLRRGQGAHVWVPQHQIVRDTGASTSIVRTLVKKGLLEGAQRQVWRDPLKDRDFVPVIPPRLTPEQADAWQIIARDLDEPAGRPFLLHGVTGSGKTEIYLRAVGRVLEQGRGAIVLVPEISLTPQTIRRFGARFPTTIAVMHSGLALGERYDQWRRLRAGELRLVIGARSALFAPVHDLGLIVLDEEHEWSYKQQSPPHYHAREVALWLARHAPATCIFGSATPALESAYRAERGAYVRLSMPRRILGHRRIVEEQAARLSLRQVRYRARPLGETEDAGAPVGEAPPLGGGEEAMYAELPPVQIVDMRAELRAGNTQILSRALKSAIDEALAAKEQIILFLNRRGSATFVMCRDCGHVARCPHCEVPLTFHATLDELVCHHCGHREPIPTQCPECLNRRIRYFGTGTQRVEQVIHQGYPQARILRWDLDTSSKLGHEAILERFVKGQADIMIGTQMIAKGLDLPRVTLVGVITADTMINLPDLRAGERTFQLLTQVAGRAGRSILGGRVIIQTYAPDHPAVQAASRHDYDLFYAQEIAFRREHWYPPISRIVRLVYADPSEQKAQEEAEHLHKVLALRIAQLGLPEIDLIGPAPAFFARLRGESRWQILVRGSDPHALVRDIRFPLGWSVDVDPVSIL